MADVTIDLLKTHFRQLRLPTMGAEFEKLARDAAATNQTFVQFLLRLTELELATRAANTVATRIKQAGFPVLKDFNTYDFSVMPGLSKPKILELSRCAWIEQKTNRCLVGHAGDEQPAVQRVEPDLSGGADDGHVVGPADPSVPHFRDER